MQRIDMDPATERNSYNILHIIAAHGTSWMSNILLEDITFQWYLN